MSVRKVKTGKRGKSRVSVNTAPNNLPMVNVALVVTRQSGDTERYTLAEVPNLLYAIEYRRKLVKVPVPKRLVSKDLKEAA